MGDNGDDRIPDTLAFEIVGGTTGTTGSQINAKTWDDAGRQRPRYFIFDGIWASVVPGVALKGNFLGRQKYGRTSLVICLGTWLDRRNRDFPDDSSADTLDSAMRFG